MKKKRKKRSKVSMPKINIRQFSIDMSKITIPKITFRRRSISLVFPFSVVSFLVLSASGLLFALFISIFTEIDVASGLSALGPGVIILAFAFCSIIFGICFSFLFVKIPIAPVNELIYQIRRLAKGDFKTRLKIKGAMSVHPAFVEVSESFNKLAEELENTEMLRSDFINNFSHEFKTPIVSISGFAKLVNKGKLTEEQRSQYLKAIEEESLRLATMATNVLKLTKVENQNILTNISCYNLSEQLRSCVLLLENKWADKNLELQLDFDEYSIQANEEFLREVWINLIDNAVKFANEGGTVSIDVAESDGVISVSVSNTGSSIGEEEKKRIFNKFYQSDESHSSAGYGIGLAIVKHVVELHRGDISVTSGENNVSFTVRLPASV